MYGEIIFFYERFFMFAFNYKSFNYKNTIFVYIENTIKVIRLNKFKKQKDKGLRA